MACSSSTIGGHRGERGAVTVEYALLVSAVVAFVSLVIALVVRPEPISAMMRLALSIFQHIMAVLAR